MVARSIRASQPPLSRLLLRLRKSALDASHAASEPLTRSSRLPSGLASPARLAAAFPERLVVVRTLLREVSGATSTIALDNDSLDSLRRPSLSSSTSTLGCSLSRFRHAPLLPLFCSFTLLVFYCAWRRSMTALMEHGNPRLPSALAGDNSAGQTRGFNLKIATQYQPSSGAPPSIDQPPISVAQSVLTGGPSAPQLTGQATSATTMHSQPVVSIATSSTGA